MKFWEEIINRASLGSTRQPLRTSDIPEYIAGELVLQDSQDAEEDFLRFASLAYQYRQGGSQPPDFQTIVQPVAAEETKAYCTALAGNILYTILAEEHQPFLELWLSQCASKGLCVPPEIVPSLLDIAARRKELRKLVMEVCGNRGVWLTLLNPAWNFFSSTQDQQAIWETGKPEERKELLRELRKQNPAEAITLLQTTWASEGANEKAAFLDILKVNLSAADLPWLEALKEKGQKVNTAVLELMKLIPASSVVQQYQAILKDTVTIKTGKALLGMINKSTLSIDETVAIPEPVFKTGIDKLSNSKNVSDGQYILVQLISAVPPAFWNDHLQLPAEEIIALFRKEKHTAFYMPALALAAVRFQDHAWIKNILDRGGDVIDSSIIMLLGALPAADRERYAIKFFDQKPAEVIMLMQQSDREWSLELARKILRHTANEVYIYNRAFYRPASVYIPVEILSMLESFNPADEQ
ncbi:MAG TPA: DUF5691 domain-containing protein, partial [Ohtaekwangia sp.]|uniref:DUF5691 domain-containing protein n=1 Tax=Ohtaekwangia sp. TaxID=2066019 RepID=UPI002F933EA6